MLAFFKKDTNTLQIALWNN